MLKTSFWSYLLAQRSANEVFYVVGILEISLPIWVLNVVRLVWIERLFYFVDICLLFKKKKLISVSPLSLPSASTWRTGSASIRSRCFLVHSLFTVQPTQLLLWRNPLHNSPSPLAFLFRASRKITAHTKWVYILDPVGHQEGRNQVLSCWPPERHIKSCWGILEKTPKRNYASSKFVRQRVLSTPALCYSG